MLTPSAHISDHDETYCIYSLRIIIAVQILIFLNMLSGLCSLTLFIAPVDLLLPDYFFTCIGEP